MKTPLDECPLCHASGSMIETLTVGYFCGCCSEVFEIDAHGHVLRRHPTNHSTRRRIDVNGAIIDGD